MNKTILLVLFLFILPFALAEDVKKSVTTSVTVTIDTGANNVKIKTEDGERTFSIGNSSNTFSYNFDRNFSMESACEDDFQDVKEIVEAMKIDCSSISTNLKSTTSYYEPYLSCTSERSTCQSSLTAANNEVARLKPYESDKATCLNDKTTMQTNLDKESQDKTTCMTERDNYKALSEKYSNHRFIGFALGILSVFGYRWYLDRQKSGKDPVGGSGEEPK